MKNSEQRGVKRHQGRLPISMKGGQGISRDFNVSGIFFETDRSFSPGQPIEFSILLEHTVPGPPVRMRCLGEIIRVEETGPKFGVAASIRSYAFVEA